MIHVNTHPLPNSRVISVGQHDDRLYFPSSCRRYCPISRNNEKNNAAMHAKMVKILLQNTIWTFFFGVILLQ